jgi:colicin import membrane protein
MAISTKNVVDAEQKTDVKKPRKSKKDVVVDAAANAAPEAEVEEPIVVDEGALVKETVNALVKHNITEQALATMEHEFMQLKIAGLDDKDGYKAVYEARIMVKNTRVLTKKVCKAKRDVLNKEVKANIAKEDEIVERLEKVETYLASEEKKIDDLKQEIKDRQEKEEQVRLQTRAADLIGRCGMKFENDGYVLDEIRISAVQVKTLDEFTFGQLMAGVERKYIERQELQAEQNRQAEEKAAENRRILEEAKAKEEENIKKERELQARQKAIEEAEAKAKHEEDSRIIQAKLAEIKAVEDRLKTRKSALFSLGFALQGEDMVFTNVKIPVAKLIAATEQEWPQWIDRATTVVKKEKDRIEAERIAREDKIAKDAAEKAITDALEKTKAEELERQRIANLAPDGEKLTTYFADVLKVAIPSFATEEYKALGVELHASLSKMIIYFNNKKPK